MSSMISCLINKYKTGQ